MTFPGDTLWQRLRDARVFRHPAATVLGVLVALLTGEALLLWATARWGLGANSDGLTYLVLARQWWRTGMYVWPIPTGLQPMTHFPPGYPQALVALLPLTQGNEELAARVLAVVALAGLVVLAARQVFGVTRHLVPTAAVALWLAVAFPVQRVVTLVLSETLFLTQMLLLAWALDAWHQRPSYRRAVLVGLLGAWTVFTRWIGVAVLLWAAWDTWYAWRGPALRSRWRQALAAALAAGLPVAALLAAGTWVSSAATGRVLRWHPPPGAKWFQAAETLVGWVTPWFHRPPAFQIVLEASAGLLAVALLVFWAWRWDPAGRAFLARWGGFALVYMIVLIAAIALADASTPMDWRLLVPVFVALSLVVIIASWTTLARHWPTALLLIWLALQVLRATWVNDRYFLIRQMHNLGAGLRNNDWQTADVWPVLRALPPEVIVVTNEPHEAAYYADRPVWPLPPRMVWRDGRAYTYNVVAGAWVPVEGAAGEPMPWAAWVAARWRGQCALVAYLTVPPVLDETRAALTELEKYLEVVQRLDSGALLRPPDAPPCYTMP